VLNAVRTARAEAPATHFLGVRLTAEEESLLEKFRTDHGLANRSEAVRALVRGATEPRARTTELPATLRNELEELVEDGYAHDEAGAMVLVLTLGIRELARTHTEHVPNLRENARSASERRTGRTRADREGRGLLRR
jgi:Arc/MetJ-type ribon-helix-helix transcriptional regulator